MQLFHSTLFSIKRDEIQINVTEIEFIRSIARKLISIGEREEYFTIPFATYSMQTHSKKTLFNILIQSAARSFNEIKRKLKSFLINFPALEGAADAVLIKRARHVIGEIERTSKAAEALKDCDFESVSIASL